MTRTEKKRLRRQLIRFQNRFGKQLGRATWQAWKQENGYA